MKKFRSAALAVLLCALLTVPALAAEAERYGYVLDPRTGSLNYVLPWGWNYGYGYVVGPSASNRTYVAPSSSGYISSTWVSGSRGLNNFQRVKVYSAGTFKDVPSGAWYEEGVRTLYEMGLLEDSRNFRPGDGLTLGEVVSFAVRVHSTYNGWSVPADMTEMQYALNIGIVTADQYDNYGDPATRRSFAVILSKALPSEALRGINVVMDEAIPDVPMSDPGSWGIYTLYRAGVLEGSDPQGTYSPNDRITRASAAVILARMLDQSQRQSANLLIPQAAGVSLSRTAMILNPGQSRTLTATVYPANAQDQGVTWASSDYRIASVDANGNVTAGQTGSAAIIATTSSGFMASCMVEVMKPTY